MGETTNVIRAIRNHIATYGLNTSVYNVLDAIEDDLNHADWEPGENVLEAVSMMEEFGGAIVDMQLGSRSVPMKEDTPVLKLEGKESVEDVEAEESVLDEEDLLDMEDEDELEDDTE